MDIDARRRPFRQHTEPAIDYANAPFRVCEFLFQPEPIRLTTVGPAMPSPLA
jgi:hypothetical protein